MPPTGFEPAIPASEWPQIHAINSVATGIGRQEVQIWKIIAPTRAPSFFSKFLFSVFGHTYCGGFIPTYLPTYLTN